MSTLASDRAGHAGTKDVLIICGSARENGNTDKAISQLVPPGASVVHLCALNVGQYDYQFRNQGDDFLPLAQKMTQHQAIVFATPVYWYAVSGHLKAFIDRMTDLLYKYKDVLKQLKDKPVGLIVSTSHPMPDFFPAPFKATCDYLNLSYQGCWEMRFSQDPQQDQIHNSAQQQAFAQWWDALPPRS